MSTDNLSKMGAAKVRLLTDQHGNQIIEKSPVSDVEYCFYERAAESLKRAVESPRLLHSDPHL